MAYQHPLVAAMSQLGAGIGQGVSGYLDTSRLLEERDRARKIQEEERARQMALQNLQFHQGEAQMARQGGNIAGAADLYRKMLEDRNDFDGGSRVGVKFEGTRTTQNSQRPTPDMSGPMPLPNAYDASKPDWKNPKNVSLLDAGIGYQAPKPELVKIGRSVGHYDSNGKFVVDHTEEDPMAGYREETLELRRQQLKDSKEARVQASIDRREARNNRPGPRTRTTTATIERDGKPVTVLINSETGDIIKEVGVKPTAKPKPAAPKPFNANAAWTEAKNNFPDDKMNGASPAQLDKRKAFVEQKRKTHAAELRRANGPDEFDKWVADKLKQGGK